MIRITLSANITTALNLVLLKFFFKKYSQFGYLALFIYFWKTCGI